MKRIVLPFLLALTFYAESLFADFFPPEIMAFGGERLFVPHFILVNLAIMGIYYFRNYALIYAAVMGLLFDVYYTELIGVYLFLFPITVYIASKISKFLQANFFVAAVITLLNVAIVEVLVYILNVLVLQVKMAPSDILFSKIMANARFKPSLLYHCFLSVFQVAAKKKERSAGGVNNIAAAIKVKSVIVEPSRDDGTINIR